MRDQCPQRKFRVYGTVSYTHLDVYKRQDLDHAIAIEEQYFSECFETEDQREGMKAFLEKRKVEKFNNR